MPSLHKLFEVLDGRQIVASDAEVQMFITWNGLSTFEVWTETLGRLYECLGARSSEEVLHDTHEVRRFARSFLAAATGQEGSHVASPDEIP